MKNNKRLCFFLPSFRTGGSEKIFVELSNFLVRNKNYDITFLCVNASGKLSILLEKSITLINLNCNSVSSSIFLLIRILKKKKPDLVISSMTHCNVILLLSKLISFSKTKIILRECSALDDLYPFDLRHPKNSLIRFMAYFLYKKADYIVSNSIDLAKDISYKFKINRIKVIYNGYEFNNIEKLSSENPNCKIFKNNKVIIAVARLSDQKGLDVLIKAFQIVRKELACKLIILGEGVLKEKLINLSKKLEIEKDIHFLGFQYNPYSYMKRSDLFVLSSPTEGLPGVLIQALALRMNIVSTNCNFGPREILKDGKLGKLVPINNEKILAKEIIISLTSTFKKPNRKDLDLERFDMNIAADKYISLIEKVIKSR